MYFFIFASCEPLRKSKQIQLHYLWTYHSTYIDNENCIPTIKQLFYNRYVD